MKRILIVIISSVALAACNNDGTSVTIKSDSLKNEVDSLGGRIDTTAEKLWDSTKAKAKNLKEKIERSIDKDSTRKDTF
ncbi:MAG: hypothetical protein ICV66_02190 [Chitinophagaceae bacterium]|nr:hypothetical protein [Chitinophagaceae bacterium]